METASKLKILEKPAIPWYEKGLRFECTGCGKCCTGKPGYVWVTKEEIKQIAAYLKIPMDKFLRNFIKQKNNRFSLIEKPSDNYACVFLKDKKCAIYPVRPTQCRTFPWWIQNLKDKESWEAAANECEGIRQEAPLVSLEEINRSMDPSHSSISPV